MAEDPSTSTIEALRKNLTRRERELEAAQKIGQALFQHLQIEEVVNTALNIALEVVDAQAGCVLLAKPESKELTFYHAIGEHAPPPGKTFPWDQGIAGTVFQTGEPMVIGDVQQDRRHFADIDKATGFTTQDLVALPLKRWEGKPIGVLEVLNKKDGKLDHDDVAILSIISAFSALAIEEARLIDEAKLAEIVRFLGDIGHDIKNLLMPVLGGANLLKEEIDELVDQLPTCDVDKAKHSQGVCHELLQMLKNNSLRIQDRVKELADCVKGASSPPRFAPCSIQTVINEVVAALRLVAEEKTITLGSEGLESLPQIEADERRLFNAFYNLVNNAIPEVPSGGSISVLGKSDSDGSGIIMSVVDTGAGMPREIQESLFSGRAISRKAGGTGLGTKIVKDVVDAHGGTIAVHSEVGKGTTFTLRFPLHPPKEKKG